MRSRLRIAGALVIGAGLLLAGLLLSLPARPALAQEPPPRPTLTPVPPTATALPPTATAAPEPEPDRPEPTAVPPGRITGTVIDQTTGAPAPGIAVQVGDTTVTSDGNGNYDRPGLPPGDYEVALRLAPGQGTPAQGPLTVRLAAGETVVQHLFFRSPAAATATAAPPTATPEPAAESPTPSAAPTAAPPRPTQLPPTGGARPGGAGLLLVAGLLLLLGAAGRARAATRG